MPPSAAVGMLQVMKRTAQHLSTASGETEILCTTSPGTSSATIVLNRPDKLNSLSMNMIQGLVGAYSQIKNAGAMVVVMKGEGRAFCAGGDVASVREAALAGGTLQNTFFFDGIHRSVSRVLIALRPQYPSWP
eukprot:COSAG05_NODE_7234_length_839_cov_10.386486_1_plen_133_part_00